MDAVKIAGPEELVKADIRPKVETYFLVTEDTLKSITGKNVLTDVFSLIASLLWGAYVSVVIATSTSINVPVTTMISLKTYKNVFLVCAIAVSILAVIFLIITYKGISRIRQSNLANTEIRTDIGVNKDVGSVEKADLES